MTKQVVYRLSEVDLHMSSQVGIEIKEEKIWNLLLLVAGSFNTSLTLQVLYHDI